MEKNIDSSSVMRSIIPFAPGSSNNTGTKGILMKSIIECFNLKSVGYHKKQALLATCTFVSAHLGENITLILTEQQDVNGLSFLNTVGEIIPDKFKSEFSELSKLIFIHTPGALKNTTHQHTYCTSVITSSRYKRDDTIHHCTAIYILFHK